MVNASLRYVPLGTEVAFDVRGAFIMTWHQERHPVKDMLSAAISSAGSHERANEDESTLRGEIENVLSSYERVGGLLENPPAHVDTDFINNHEVEAGHILGDFQILSLLGTGGMGVVYLAKDIRLSRKVALKLLPPRFTNDPDRLRRFQQEARSASALNHPNILTVHEIGETDGTYFISTEYIEGDTLRDRIVRTPLLVDETLDIALQVVSALSVAHDSGIIHRDIKPENIMIRRDGYVKVLDFGLAKLKQAGVHREPPRRSSEPRGESLGDESIFSGNEYITAVPGTTQSGVLIGTPSYMSPEQASGLAVDERSDIWSLGVVIYEMLSGHLPFRGRSSQDYIESVLKEDPIPLSRFSDSTTPILESIVMKCLEKKPERRYHTAADLHDALLEIKRDITKVREKTPLAAITERRSRIAITALLLGVVSLAILAYFWRPVSNPAVVPEIKSIAVLPFTEISSGSTQDYFADGMTGALINEMGQIGALRVISRTSVMRYKNSTATLPEIARELKVDAVVEGTVIRSQGRVRTAAKLTHVSTGQHLWSDSYERDAGDVVGLQQMLARNIAREIGVNLTPREETRLAKARPVKVEAYESYLRGRQFLDQRNVPAITSAIGYLNMATDLDPDFALPHAALADAYFALGTVHLSALPPREALDKGRAAAIKAIELDDTLAEGYTELAVIKFYSRQWPEAEEDFRHALELNPNFAPAHSWYAIYSASRGRLGEAISRIYRARELDPLSPHIAQNVGWILHYARQYDEEIEEYRRTLELDPNFLFARLRLATAYSRKGMYDEAIIELERVNNLPERPPSILGGLGFNYAISGRRSEAQRILREVLEIRRERYVDPFSIASIYLGLGDKEKTFEWLEKSCDEHSYAMVFLKVGTEYDPIRSDPRFDVLLRCAGHAS